MTPSLTCPWCFKPQLTIGIDPNRHPASGDIHLCGACAKLSIFDSPPFGLLSLRRMTSAEYDSLTPAERLDIDFAVRNIIGRMKDTIQKIR